MKKNKLVTILIAAATIILAGVAVFTAVRLFQLRKQSVSPTSPESEPGAFHWGVVVTTECNPGTAKVFTVEMEAAEDNCPGAMSVCPSTTNALTEFKTRFRIQAKPGAGTFSAPITVKLKKGSNWCPAKCGNKNQDDNYTCDENYIENEGSSETPQVTLNAANDWTDYVTITRQSDVGYACGSYQEDLWVTEIEGCSGATLPTRLTWGICYTGITCTEARPSLCNTVSVSDSVIDSNESVTITSTSKEAVKNFTYAFYNENNQYTCSADFPRNVALFADVASGDPAPTDAIWTSIWATLPQLSSGDKCDNPKGVCIPNSDTGYSTEEAVSILTSTAQCEKDGATGTRHLIYKDPDTAERTTGSVTIPYERLFYTDPMTGSVVNTMQINAYFQKADGTLTSDPERACVVHIKAGTVVPPTTTVSSCSALSFSLASEDETPIPTPTATTTATPTATATATPNSCNGTCGSNYNCNSGLYCYNGYCRDADCPTETDCSCGTAATATATSSTTTTTTVTRTATPTAEASLPNAGVSTPTIFGLGIGAVLLLISLTLAL